MNAERYPSPPPAANRSPKTRNEATMASSVGAALAGGGPLRGVLETCCRAAIDHLHAASARIWTVDPRTGTLEAQASAGVHLHLGALEIERVVAERRAHLHPTGEGGAVAGFPLLVRDRLVGAFAVSARQPFSDATLDALASIADTIAIGVERLRFEQEREVLLTELQETVRLNELFAGVLAHDLRNPLGAIVAAAHLIRLRTSDDEVTRPLCRLESSALRMTRMIEQLLDVTKIRAAGGFALHPKQTDLAEVCGQVSDELQVAHRDWRIAVDAVGDSVGSWDADRLLQVFSNLVGNAIAHGKLDGGVEVHIDGRDPGGVVIGVTNRGSIPSVHVPHLFDPFYGTQHQRSQHTRGLGLGLFITQQIVLAHGGAIDVRSSAEDDRTTFLIRLPRHRRS